MSELNDISNDIDIHRLVNDFFNRITADELLGPLFEKHVKDWPQQKDTMCRFWEAALLNKPTYQGSGLDKHQRLPLNNQHFYRWVTLFNQTVDENFRGHVAEQAKYLALNTAETFRNKISSVRF